MTTPDGTVDTPPTEPDPTPTEPVVAETTEQDAVAGEDQVIGLQGKPVRMPGGAWAAVVDQDGNLARDEDSGLLIRARE